VRFVFNLTPGNKCAHYSFVSIILYSVLGIVCTYYYYGRGHIYMFVCISDVRNARARAYTHYCTIIEVIWDWIEIYTQINPVGCHYHIMYQSRILSWKYPTVTFEMFTFLRMPQIYSDKINDPWIRCPRIKIIYLLKLLHHIDIFVIANLQNYKIQKTYNKRILMVIDQKKR